MEKGRIIKIISNQYTIQLKDQSVIAKPRGKLRLDKAPVVGDFVQVEKVEDAYRIHSIEPRKNRLLRPAIANVDQALIVTSLKDPDFSVHLLNRLILLVSLAHVEPIIVITKQDLIEDIHLVQKDLDWYKKAGYTVLMTWPGSDDQELCQVIDGKVSVLCGQSGAGKSSLLNRLDPSFQLQTQAISKALGRGRHTTRFCELHRVANGLVADTPGFSSLDFSRMDLKDLDQCIKDFAPYLHQCRFNDCRHIHEPDCAIREALAQGKINPSMYEDYIQIVKGESQ